MATEMILNNIYKFDTYYSYGLLALMNTTGPDIEPTMYQRSVCKK